MRNLVVAITGASGSLYAVRLLEVLLAAGSNVHVTISPSGAAVLEHELGLSVDLENFAAEQLVESLENLADDASLAHLQVNADVAQGGSSVFSDSDSRLSPGALIYHHHQDYSAGIASGSFQTDGMVICPCSMGTLASLAGGQSSNLIQRAADVHLKERRKLIVVPRETPLGSIQLENMKRLSDAGAVILPAMPGFYHRPESLRDLADFIVGRICDQLGIRHELIRRWGGENC
jgi:4-hydroxy-3-polyprenylbenzoate decarboxylase